MKKLTNISFAYAIAALVGGVIYREFTKIVGFTDQTNLSLLHTHLFTLGMMFFLIVLVLEAVFALGKQRLFKGFLLTYNIGLILSVIMMAVRGFFQIQGTDLSKALEASIAGLSGIGHVLLAIGMVLFFLALKRSVAEKE